MGDTMTVDPQSPRRPGPAHEEAAIA